MIKRLFSVLLIISMLLPNFTLVEAAGRQLDINTVRSKAVENSKELQNVTIDKIKKNIELQQAKDGIKDIRRAQTTVRFSLLFKIKFPERHGLPKEIELVMKAPQIMNELLILDKKKDNETLKAQVNAELAFYDVLMGEYNQKFYEERLRDTNETLKNIENQYKTGKGKKEDVDYLNNKVKSYKKDLQSAILNAESKKRNSAIKSM